MKTTPITTIMIEGIHDPALVTRVRTKVGDTLARVDPMPTGAKVIFADENGPKGGADIRCTIVSEMPRRRGLSVTELGPSAELAFDAAFGALVMSVTRDRARRRELVRRPKKYFLAKRLLSPDTTLDSPELRADSPRITAGPRPRRARRRRVA
jgi:hypothetical protein